MAAEIQSFVLCAGIKDNHGGVSTLIEASVHSVFPRSGSYPLNGKFPFYMLLRKDSKEANMPFRIELKIRDMDGKVLAIPGTQAIEGTLPAGHRFWAVRAALEIEIPKAGDYSIYLDFVPREAGGASYRYDLEAMLPDAPPGS